MYAISSTVVKHFFIACFLCAAHELAEPAPQLYQLRNTRSVCASRYALRDPSLHCASNTGGHVLMSRAAENLVIHSAAVLNDLLSWNGVGTLLG